MDRSTIDRNIMRMLCRLTGGRRRDDGLYRARVLSGPLRGQVIALPLLQRPAMILGTYERHVVRAIQAHLPVGGVGYDIGAYVGYLTMVMAEAVGPDGTVVAFEASPNNAAALRYAIDRNRLERVEVVEQAASDTDEPIVFATFEYATVDHPAREGTPDDARLVEVRATTLDSYVFEHGNPPPDLIKIDVNGAESSVLRGARRVLAEHGPAVLVEIRTETSEAIRELMSDVGYAGEMLDSVRQANAGLFNVLYRPT